MTEKYPPQEYLPINQMVYHGTPDEFVLKKAIQRNLVIVTRDKRFILRAIKQGVNIVYQDDKGQRYYIYGSKTEKLKELGHCHRDDNKSNSKKHTRIVSQFTPSRVSIFGMDSWICF